MRRWVIAVGSLALVGAVAVTPAYVFPASDLPAATDVVYVIGPPSDERMEVARQMVADGLTSAVMVSLDPEEYAEWPAAARACAGATEKTDASTDPGARTGLWTAEPETAHAQIHCSKPDPFTTRGEARELALQMAEHNWESSAVVTFTPHITRARMIMDRCETGGVAVVDADESIPAWFWVYSYAYQTAGFAKATILQGC